MEFEPKFEFRTRFWRKNLILEIQIH